MHIRYLLGEVRRYQITENVAHRDILKWQIVVVLKLFLKKKIHTTGINKLQWQFD